MDGVGADAGAMMVLPVSGVESTGTTSSGSESDNSSTWALRDMVEDVGGVMGSGRKKVREREWPLVFCAGGVDQLAHQQDTTFSFFFPCYFVEL